MEPINNHDSPLLYSVFASDTLTSRVPNIPHRFPTEVNKSYSYGSLLFFYKQCKNPNVWSSLPGLIVENNAISNRMKSILLSKNNPPNKKLIPSVIYIQLLQMFSFP